MEKAIGTAVAWVGMRIFLTAWLVDILYDKFAPADFIHFGYWTAVLAVVLFYLGMASLSDRRKGKS